MAGQILQDQSFGAKHPLVREVGGATRQREMAPPPWFRSFVPVSDLFALGKRVCEQVWPGGEIHTSN